MNPFSQNRQMSPEDQAIQKELVSLKSKRTLLRFLFYIFFIPFFFSFLLLAQGGETIIVAFMGVIIFGIGSFILFVMLAMVQKRMQNMALGFVGKKVYDFFKKKPEPAQAPSLQDVSFSKRAMLLVEDGEFEKANEYAEKALDINPETAEAYLVKFLVEHKVSSIQHYLSSHSLGSLQTNKNYQKAERFASNEFKQYLEDQVKISKRTMR
jgi:tetratricopeptide (TPR) repeat protein